MEYVKFIIKSVVNSLVFYPKMKSVSVMCIYGGNFSIVVGNNAGGKIVYLLVFTQNQSHWCRQHSTTYCYVLPLASFASQGSLVTNK